MVLPFLHFDVDVELDVRESVIVIISQYTVFPHLTVKESISVLKSRQIGALWTNEILILLFLLFESASVTKSCYGGGASASSAFEWNVL